MSREFLFHQLVKTNACINYVWTHKAFTFFIHVVFPLLMFPFLPPRSPDSHTHPSPQKKKEEKSKVHPLINFLTLASKIALSPPQNLPLPSPSSIFTLPTPKTPPKPPQPTKHFSLHLSIAQLLYRYSSPRIIIIQPSQPAQPVFLYDKNTRKAGGRGADDVH